MKHKVLVQTEDVPLFHVQNNCSNYSGEKSVPLSFNVQVNH